MIITRKEYGLNKWNIMQVHPSSVWTGPTKSTDVVKFGGGTFRRYDFNPFPVCHNFYRLAESPALYVICVSMLISNQVNIKISRDQIRR